MHCLRNSKEYDPILKKKQWTKEEIHNQKLNTKIQKHIMISDIINHQTRCCSFDFWLIDKNPVLTTDRAAVWGQTETQRLVE